MYAYSDAVIMVFCKAPIAGQVKTRLIPDLTAEEAAQLHRELTEKTLQKATHNHLCAVQLWCSPHLDHPFFIDLSTRYSIPRQIQQGDDLGERMHHAFVHILTRYKRAIIIGCDCPSLTTHDLEQAIIELSQPVSCVIAPAEDGGYVLIGLNTDEPSLFSDMPWGTVNVLNETRRRIASLQRHYCELSTQWDVDTYDDLVKYQKLLTI